MWFAIAGRNNVFPLDDRTPRERLTDKRSSVSGARTEYTYYPGTAEIPEGVAPNIRNRSYALRAVLDVTEADASGIVVAQGSRFGGHALFLKDGKLQYGCNFLGIDETIAVAVADEQILLGNATVEVVFAKDHEEPRAVAHGTVTILVGGTEVASAWLRTQPRKFALAGEGLAVGRDSADPVSQTSGAGFESHGFTIDHVTVSLSGDHYVDEEIEALGMLARE